MGNGKHAAPTLRLPRREAPHERMYRYVCGSAQEGPGIACCIGEKHNERVYNYLCGFRTKGPGTTFYFVEKHTVDVLIVISVASARKAPVSCFTSARSTT